MRQTLHVRIIMPLSKIMLRLIEFSYPGVSFVNKTDDASYDKITLTAV